jgi:prolyl oligopeptidase
VRADGDPYVWLEDIDGEAGRDWVRAQNATTLAELCSERFEQLRTELQELYNADDPFPRVHLVAGYLYNFFRDPAHSKGVWRRTTLEQFRTDTPEWDVLLDLRHLSGSTKNNWNRALANVIRPEGTRALIGLANHLVDGAVVREFDFTTREFVDDGFWLPQGHHEISWEDENTVIMGTDFGAGSLTRSGRPRLVKRWRRGQRLDDAELLFCGSASDVAVWGSVDRTPGFERTFLHRRLDRHNVECFEWRAGSTLYLDIPADAQWSVHHQWALIRLRSDWHTAGGDYAAESLLAADYEQLVAGTVQPHVVFAPDPHTVLKGFGWTGDRLLLVTAADAVSRVDIVTPGSWRRQPVAGVGEHISTSIHTADGLGGEVILECTGFGMPRRLLHGDASGPLRQIKSEPASFDASDLTVKQHFAISADGTSIPYFVVGHRDPSGPTPTLMHAHGGFGITLEPAYWPVEGRVWLARGGTFVIANIRGGGEYGPVWHTGVMRENRHKVSEDFAAVAADLVARGITTAGRLGASGLETGGLLTGIMLTQYPQLFGALVCDMPLLDMRRYRLLNADASWTAQYGDPDDPAAWEFIGKYSPYHNISAGRQYPPVLITTAIHDERLPHPGHARKMTAALQAAGHRVYYFDEREYLKDDDMLEATGINAALKFEFLLRTLADPDPGAAPDGWGCIPPVVE